METIHRVWFCGELQEVHAHCTATGEGRADAVQRVWRGPQLRAVFAYDEVACYLLDLLRARPCGAFASFASDYFRLALLGLWGGWYMDTDVLINRLPGREEMGVREGEAAVLLVSHCNPSMDWPNSAITYATQEAREALREVLPMTARRARALLREPARLRRINLARLGIGPLWWHTHLFPALREAGVRCGGLPTSLAVHHIPGPQTAPLCHIGTGLWHASAGGGGRP